jgi:hypothetical protein
MCPCHKGASAFPHRTAVAALQTTASQPTSVGDGYARSCSSQAETWGSTRYRTTSFPGTHAAGFAGPLEEGVRDPCANDAASRVAEWHKLAATVLVDATVRQTTR